MIIGLDLDGTIVNNKSLTYKLLNGFTHKFLGTGKSKSRIIDTTKRYKKTTFNRLFSCLKPKKFYTLGNSTRIINEWHKNNIIIIISSRPSKMKSVLHLTQENINRLGIKADLVVLGVKDKAEFCRKYDIDYFIDNNIITCENISKNSNTQSICLNPNVYQSGYYSKVVSSWQEAYDFVEQKEEELADYMFRYRMTPMHLKSSLEDRVKNIIKNSIDNEVFYKNSIDAQELNKLFERAELLDDKNTFTR